MRALTMEELGYVSGGDCGGGCGAGGSCGDGSCPPGTIAVMQGDGSIACATSVSATGTAQITITGSGIALGDGGLSAQQAAAFGALLGSATGTAAFVAGILPAAMTWGEAMAFGAMVGGVTGVAAVTIVGVLAIVYGLVAPPESTGP